MADRRFLGSYTTAAARRKGDPVTFDIDGEDFTAASDLPGGALLDMAALRAAGDNFEKMAILGSFMDAVLYPDSAARFSARLRDPEHPLDLTTAMRIMIDLFRELSGNPTAAASPSPPSPSAPGEDPTGSTLGASPAA